RVELKNTQTGEVRETKTDETGFYQFPCPDLGTYDLVFSLQDFETHALLGIKRMGPQDRRIDEVMYLDRPAGSQERTYLWIRVLDESSHPIPGVAGGIDDFPIGTLRTMDCGCTWADSKPGKHVLRIQKEGYDEKTVPLDVAGRFMNIEVVLHRLPKAD
ncbi:MAG: carboxypeptidase-like regulatory domain-containing protein, partial [Acidobacteriota bacterium]